MGDGERGLQASRVISSLEIIVQEDPLIFCPKDIEDCCLWCGCDDVDPCDDCGYPVCSSCVKNHLQEECHLLAKCRQVTTDIVLMLRMISIMKQGGATWSQIETMKAHTEERRQNENEWKRVQTDVIDVVQKVIEDDLHISLLHKMYGILSINCVTTDDVCALYPTLAMVNHSCVANSVYTINANNSIVLRAKRKIEDDEEITISYVSVWCGQPRRRSTLLNRWFFDCRCPRCCDVTELGTNLSAFKCESCYEGLVLPVSTDVGCEWTCRFCGNPSSSTAVIILIEKLESDLFKILESDSDDTVQLLQRFISKNSRQLHSKHYLNIIAQRHIITILSEKKTFTREVARKIIQLGKSIKSSLSPLDTGYSEWLGFILKMINMSQLQILKLNLQEKKINKNVFAEESESIWKAMKEVENCEILSSSPI